MSKAGVEGGLDSRVRGQRFRLRRQSLRVPDDVLNQGSEAAEQWLQEHSTQRIMGVTRDSSNATRLRRLGMEFRRTRKQRRSQEEAILAEHPLMVYHDDGKHIFYGTDIDQQFSS